MLPDGPDIRLASKPGWVFLYPISSDIFFIIRGLAGYEIHYPASSPAPRPDIRHIPSYYTWQCSYVIFDIYQAGSHFLNPSFFCFCLKLMTYEISSFSQKIKLQFFINIIISDISFKDRLLCRAIIRRRAEGTFARVGKRLLI